VAAYITAADARGIDVGCHHVVTMAMVFMDTFAGIRPGDLAGAERFSLGFG
jgi:hypothetical protein